MNDQKKTKSQLIDELIVLRKKVSEPYGLKKSRPSTLDEAPHAMAFYEHLLENIDEGILVTDKNDKIFFVNGPMAKIAGVSKEQILGVVVLRDFSEDTLRYFRLHYVKAKETLNAVSYDSIEALTPAGRMTYQSGTVVPMVKDGQFNGMICTIHDITGHKRAEEALRTSEQKYRLVLENANEVIFIAQDGMLKYINPAAIRLVDYAEQVILSKPFTEFIHPEDRSMVLERHLKRMKGEEVPDIYPFRVIASNGTAKWVQIHATQIEWEGRPATINFLTDITIRKQAEEDRERLILELREALSKIKTLSGMLPICASCKKIRDDKGYWNQIESYIKRHSEAEFSHSICPECAKILYPDHYKKMYPNHKK